MSARSGVVKAINGDPVGAADFTGVVAHAFIGVNGWKLGYDIVFFYFTDGVKVRAVDVVVKAMYRADGRISIRVGKECRTFKLELREGGLYIGFFNFRDGKKMRTCVRIKKPK